MNFFNESILQYSFPLWQTTGTALLLLGAFYGCGKLLLHRKPDEEFIAFSVGCAVFMTFFAFLPPVRGVLFAAVLPFALFGVWQVRTAVRKNPGKTLFISLFFLAALGSALLIPYAWDEQTYQLALPLRCLQTGSSGPFPDNPYSFYPALTGWFFTNIIKLGGLELPRIIVGAITPVLILSVWRMTRRYGKTAAVSGVCAMLLSPLVLNMNRAVYVENFIALFTAGAVFAFWKLRKNFFAAPLVCGILAGSALAVKPTGITGALLLFILFAARYRQWKELLIFCGTAFLFSFFWYLRTFFLTGSFFYPYALAPLPGSVEHFHQLMGSARYGLDGINGTVLNWLFAGFDRKLFDGIVTGFHLPFLGICAAAGLFLWRRKHLRFTFLVSAAVTAFLIPLLLWSAVFPQTRFLLPLLPFFAAGGIAAVSQFPDRKIFFGLLGILMGCTLFFQARQPLYHYFISWKILPHVRRDPGRALSFLTRDPGLYKAFAYLAENTPPAARCLLLMERRGLYSPRPYALAVPGFEPSLTPVPESSEKLFEKFSHFDYIMVGATTQDVDLQSANTEACKQVFEQVKELIDCGKLRPLASPGYPVLQVIKKGGTI